MTKKTKQKPVKQLAEALNKQQYWETRIEKAEKEREKREISFNKLGSWLFSHIVY